MISFLLAFVLIFVATATHAATAIEPAFNTSFCVENSSTNNGQVMTITACGGAANQSFTFTPVGSYYTIEPVNNPTVCLSYGYGSATNGSTVEQTTCYANTPQQQWQIVSNSNGTYSILTSTGGGELAASGTYLGAALVTEAPASVTTQEFLLPGFSTTPAAPTVSISANPTSIVSGESSTLTWSSTNATSCTASGGWSGSEATSAMTSVAPTVTTTYTLTCTGSGGSANASATITVTTATPPPPSVSISANPTSVTSGGSITLAWSSTNTTACTASNGWSGTEATSGTQPINNFAATTTFTLTCTGAGGSANQSVTVTVTAAPPPSVPTAPRQAQAAGYTNLIFDEEFNTLNLSPNGSGTYTWYNGIWYEAPSSASDLTVTNSVFAATETPSDPHDSSITTMNRGAGPSTVFRYGYFEARMSWNTIPANWAAFWLFSIAHAQGTDTIPTGEEWCELDIFEAFGNGNEVGTVHDWVLSNGTITNTQNTNNYQPLNGIDMSQFHIYGVLWTPSTITWYFDNQAIMSWPTPAICQTQQLFMILGTQVHPPQTSNVFTNVDWVHVYH